MIRRDGFLAKWMMYLTLAVTGLLIPACKLPEIYEATPVKTSNTHEGGGHYTIRLHAIADAFHTDTPLQGGLIALQEVKPDMQNCHCAGWSGPAHGAKCLSLLLRERYSDASIAWAGQHALGIVVGKPWTLIDSNYWPIGKDDHITSITPTDSRYLLEAKVLSTNGRKLKFYSTHLSHDSQTLLGPASGKAQRLSQITNLKRKVQERAEVGELPPIVAGDFNFTASESESFSSMSADFNLIYSNSVDHIWVGKPTAFPRCSGTLVMTEGKTLDFRASRSVTYSFGGTTHSYTGELSDHPSLRVTLTIKP